MIAVYATCVLGRDKSFMDFIEYSYLFLSESTIIYIFKILIAGGDGEVFKGLLIYIQDGSSVLYPLLI